MKKKYYSVPSSIEPKVEYWLEKRNISFEVSTTGKKDILKVIPNWGDISQKEIVKIDDRIEALIRKEKEKLIQSLSRE